MLGCCSFDPLKSSQAYCDATINTNAHIYVFFILPEDSEIHGLCLSYYDPSKLA